MSATKQDVCKQASHQELESLTNTLRGPDSWGGLKVMGRGCCALCQVSTVAPKGQVFLKLQQALLVVEAHVVRSAGLPSQVQIQGSAYFLLT